MLHITDDEREKMIQEEYPQFEFERYNISEDIKEKFFWKNGQAWTLYDIPDLALCRTDIFYRPPNPKEWEEWKSRHYVGSETDTRWRIKKKTE